MTIALLKSNVSPSTGYFAFETPRDPEEGMSPISRWLSYTYTYEDLTLSIVSFHVPPGSMVLRVAHRVEEAFTGVINVIVGDGDDDNGWIRTSVISMTTAGDFTLDEGADLVATGKYYPDGDTIDVETTLGPASAGVGHIHIEVISYAEELAVE